MEAMSKMNPHGWRCQDKRQPGVTSRFTRQRRLLPGMMIGLTLLAEVVSVLPCAAQGPWHAEDNLLAQNTTPNSRRPPVPPHWGGTPPFHEANPDFTAKRLKVLNEQRQRSLVANTNKLLKLAKELNAEVNGGQAGELTKAQLRKVSEIEKLARKVKSEMSFGPVGAQTIEPSPFPPLIR